jgi:vanillate/3-O-methylgallate O-demethylase
MAQPVSAVYTGERLRPYREWLRGDGYEGKLSVGGSFRSDQIEDYYVTPWEFGYEHLVKFDHDFIGREALEARAQRPALTKVWLRWNDEDVARVYASSLFGNGTRAKYLETPLARYARVMCDAVERDGAPIGVANMAGYTVNIGSWASVAMVDPVQAQDGAEVELVWGEEDGGTRKQTVEHHVQTRVRATMSVLPLGS